MARCQFANTFFRLRSRHLICSLWVRTARKSLQAGVEADTICLDFSQGTVCCPSQNNNGEGFLKMDPKSPVVSVLKSSNDWVKTGGYTNDLGNLPLVTDRCWRGATESPARSDHQDTGSQCMSLKPSAGGSKALDIVDRTLGIKLKGSNCLGLNPLLAHLAKSAKDSGNISLQSSATSFDRIQICRPCATFYQQSWRLWVLISRLKQMVFLG